MYVHFRLGKELAAPFCLALVCLACVGFLTGCGTASAPIQAAPVQGGPTSLTITASATANDQLAGYAIRFSSLSLVNQAGESVPLIQAPQTIEFLDSGGFPIPVINATVPQGTYTDIKATIDLGQFVYLVSDPATGGTDIQTDATRGPSATFSLSSPIVLSEPASMIRLDLQGSGSASVTSHGTQETYSLTPTFVVSPIALSRSVTVSGAEISDLYGRVSGVTASGLTITLAQNGFMNAAGSPQQGLPVNVSPTATTIYTGISGLAQLSIGTLVNVDLSYTADGSVVATRIEADDPVATDVSVGPAFFTSTIYRDFNHLAFMQQGDYLSINPREPNIPYNFQADPTFQTSPQVANLQSLPFRARFDNTSFSVGQRFAVYSHQFTAGQFPAPSTIVLAPQTLNGTIQAIKTEGAFTVYSISLAKSDLQVQFGGPSQVQVYTDSSTTIANSASLTVGSNIRTRGLLFNDAGTYRLDCSSVLTGVSP